MFENLKIRKFGFVSSFVFRIFLGAVFAYAGFSKLMEPAGNFRGVLSQYEIIPYALVPAIAAVLPWLEFVFGVFMILGYLPRVSALVLGLLCLGFIAILGASKLFLGSLPASCGCFGEGGIHLTPLQVVLLDFFNLFIALKIFSIHSHPLSLDSWLKKS